MKNRFAFGLIPFALLSVAAKGNGCATAEEPITDGPDAAVVSDCPLPEPKCPAGSVYSVAGCACVSETPTDAASPVTPTDAASSVTPTDAASSVTPTDAASSVTATDAAPGVPEVVASVPSVGFIAVDDTNVYIAPYETGEVGFVPKGGGTWTELDAVATSTIAIDANRVYTVSPDVAGSPELVVACAKTGCDNAPTTLASGQAGVWGVAVDDTNVYWTIQGGAGGVLKAPLVGGSPTMLVPGVSATSIVAGGGTVFYASNYELMSAPVAGGPATLVYSAPGNYGIGAIALDATNVYFTAGGLIGRIPVGGGAATILATGQGNGVESVAVDDANVYWAGTDSIVSVPIAGGATRVIASGQDYPDGIAVDATSVYWSVLGAPSGGGMIMKIAK